MFTISLILSMVSVPFKPIVDKSLKMAQKLENFLNFKRFQIGNHFDYNCHTQPKLQSFTANTQIKLLYPTGYTSNQLARHRIYF